MPTLRQARHDTQTNKRADGRAEVDGTEANTGSQVMSERLQSSLTQL